MCRRVRDLRDSICDDHQCPSLATFTKVSFEDIDRRATILSLSHGGNRGSNPLGSTIFIKRLGFSGSPKTLLV